MGRSKKAYSLLKPNGHTPFFRVRWRDSRWRSTQTLKTVDEAAAAQFAAQLYEEKLLGVRNLTLSAYAKDFFLWGKCIWLTKRTEEGAVISKKIASQHRAHLVNYILPQFGSLLLRNIKPRLFEDWRRALKLSNATRNHIRNTFKLIMEQALYDELVLTNPIAITRPLSKQVYERRDVFTSDEIEQLFPSTVRALTKIWGTYQFAVMFLILASTGMRSGEARALTWTQIHLQEKSIDVDRAINCDGVVGPTKSKKNRVVLLPETVVTHLAHWQKQSAPSKKEDFVFPGRKPGCPLSKEWIIERFYLGLKSAGINQDGRRNLVPHSFRHTFISRLSSELPPEVINLLSGHSTDQMRLRYTHTTSAELLKQLTPYRDALDKVFGNAKAKEASNRQIKKASPKRQVRRSRQVSRNASSPASVQ